jgi:hypothetical protein
MNRSDDEESLCNNVARRGVRLPALIFLLSSLL